MDSTETQPTEYTKLGPRGMIAAGLILAGIGLLLAFVLEGSASKYGYESESWPLVEGVVTTSDVKGFGPRDDRSYRPEVRYRYSVDGQEFTSSRVSFAAAAIQSHVQSEIAQFVDQYRSGTKLTVYYKPSDPAVSCLETGVRLGTGFIIGIGCILIGLLVTISGVVAAFREGMASSWAEPYASGNMTCAEPRSLASPMPSRSVAAAEDVAGCNDRCVTSTHPKILPDSERQLEPGQCYSAFV